MTFKEKPKKQQKKDMLYGILFAAFGIISAATATVTPVLTIAKVAGQTAAQTAKILENIGKTTRAIDLAASTINNLGTSTMFGVTTANNLQKAKNAP